MKARGRCNGANERTSRNAGTRVPPWGSMLVTSLSMAVSYELVPVVGGGVAMVDNAFPLICGVSCRRRRAARRGCLGCGGGGV